MNMNITKFENHIWWPGLLQGVLWATCTIFALWLWISIEGNPIDAIVYAISALIWFGCFYATGFGSEILNRPKIIEIKESGVVLHHRFGGKIEEIPWSNIYDVTIPNKKGPLESGIDGWLGVSKRKRWNIQKAILIKIREKYIEKIGHPPRNFRENA
ncbi:MAG: hypothetical protein WC375_09485 [Methanomassiliicoccales archaeon]